MSLPGKFAVILGIGLLLASCASPGTRTQAPSTVKESKPAVVPPSKESKPTVVPPPKSSGYYEDDGPGANPPPNLDAVPDAVPKAEPLHRFANSPYTVNGVTYVPDTSGKPYLARGLASWYGRRFHGRPTASGEPYDMYAMTAAHRTLPIPSYARVTNLANGRSVIVRINDRGPFHPGRIIDLSYTAAYKLGLLDKVGMVEVELLRPPIKDQNKAATNRRPDAAPASTQRTLPAAKSIYLQVGAFSRLEGAQALAEQLAHSLGRQVPGVLQRYENGLIKVQIGPYNSAEEATRAATRLNAILGYKPYMVVR